MTGLRWTPEAAADLEQIANYLFEKAPERAGDLVQRLYGAAGALLTFPYRGRPGKKPGTRELVLFPLPYLVVYRITGAVTEILRIRHGAQKWP